MTELQLKFFTRQSKYVCSATTYTLPGSSISDDLNKMLLTVLLQEEKITEKDALKLKFDFLIQDQFLRSSVINHVDGKSLSFEDVLDVEYMEQQNTPELKQSYKCNDWISSTKLSDDYVLFGSFDATVSVWSKETGKVVFEGNSHTDSVKDVAWISTGNKGDDLAFASASMDQKIIIWKKIGEKLKPKFSCTGHREGVLCLATNCQLMASGSWDKTIGIWSASLDQQEKDKKLVDPDTLSNKKRQKLEERGLPRKSLTFLTAHTENVSGVSWIDSDTLVSSSWDHSVKIWDVNTEKVTTDMRAALAILSIEYSPLNKLLASGCSDRHIRIWDPRSSEGKVVKTHLTSHHNWVSCVRWSPSNEHHLVSGSFDHFVKTWDIRSTKTPLFNLKAHSDNVTSVDWLGDEITSGGKDSKLFLYSSKSETIISEVV